jgi:hypothetical protein
MWGRAGGSKRVYIEPWACRVEWRVVPRRKAESSGGAGGAGSAGSAPVARDASAGVGAQGSGVHVLGSNDAETDKRGECRSGD